MGKTILAVDDEAQTREFVYTVLEENGYTPIMATNGEEAMALIKEQRPDLIIMDILMPRQSGIKLYRDLKADDTLKQIPVIVYSGIARRTLFRAQASRTEHDEIPVPEPEGYIEKPAAAEHLAAVVRKALPKNG